MSRIRDLFVLAAAALAAGIVAVVSLHVHTFLSDPSARYRAAQYTDFGGAFRGLFDTAAAFTCGALLGIGMAVRLGAFGPRERSRWPWYIDVVPAAILIYLVLAANFG